MSSSRRICAPCGRPRRYFGVVFDGWHAWQSIRTVDAVLAENFHLGVDMDELKVALETLGCVLDSATDLIDVEPLVAFCMPRKVRMILPAVSIWLACKKGDVDGLKAWLAIDGDPTWRLPDAISPSTTPVSVAIRLASNCSCRDMSVKQPHKLVDSRWISTLYCRLWNINDASRMHSTVAFEGSSSYKPQSIAQELDQSLPRWQRKTTTRTLLERRIGISLRRTKSTSATADPPSLSGQNLELFQTRTL
ncbi:hypothetical protein AC1031_020867 [Aphanomyces cochlioides]|nr:hypothetical protein AC1031_020867 [Aphanomyces cochlioides]